MEKVILYFKKLLSLSYSETKGFVKLLIVCLVALVLMFLPRLIVRSDDTTDPSDVKSLDSLVRLLEKNQNEAILFSFDPNVLSVDSLRLLGFPQKVAERLANYRQKGGNFRVKNDVKKIYGISDELFLEVAAYIDLPDSIQRDHLVNMHFDINKADANELKAISGVGEVLAGRIIKFRDMLGGFIQLEQLNEVYGLKDKALENVRSRVFINSAFKPRTIKINKALEDELAAHPYISTQFANDIIRYRELNHAIESEKLLASFKSVDKGNFEKLIFYLDFQ